MQNDKSKNELAGYLIDFGRPGSGSVKRHFCDDAGRKASIIIYSIDFNRGEAEIRRETDESRRTTRQSARTGRGKARCSSISRGTAAARSAPSAISGGAPGR